MKAYDKESRIYESLQPFKRYCKCGHTVFVMHGNKKLCDWCGHYVYTSEQEEFKDRLNSAKMKIERSEKNE